MTAKEEYRQLCAKEPSIPLFSRDWWLDAVVGSDSWDAVVVADSLGEITGALPYCFSKNLFGGLVIFMPALTQTLGPWLKYPDKLEIHRKAGFETSIIERLLAGLPRFAYFKQSLHYSITNWLPFYWNGYRQSTAYTYIIPDLSDTEGIYSHFNKDRRNEIRKAEAALRIVTSGDVDKFFEINKMTFERKHAAMPYGVGLLRRLDRSCDAKGCRRIFLAADASDNVVAAEYVVWDPCSAYDLMSGMNPSFPSSKGRTLLIWNAIRFASTVTRKFDFEGSMGRNLESFIRDFGAIQVPYMIIRKSAMTRLENVIDIVGRISPFRDVRRW